MKDLEFNRADPGAEITPPPAEFGAGRAREYAPLPPEYGQTSGPNEAPKKKRRFLRQAILLAAVIPLGWMYVRAQKPAAPQPDVPPGPGPVETVEPTGPTGPADTDVPPTAESTLPPAPYSHAVSADLYIMKEDAGEAYGFFDGHIDLVEGDPTTFDPVPKALTVQFYDADGFTLGSNVALTDLDKIKVTTDEAGNWRYSYEGIFQMSAHTEEAAAYDMSLEIEDRGTGTLMLTSNKIEQKKYPLGNGQIVVTFYNDTTTWEVPSADGVGEDYGLTILMRQTFDEATFTDVVLPKFVNPDPLKSYYSGCIIRYGNPFDNGADQMTDVEPFTVLMHHVDTEGNLLLTREDVLLIPPSADGNRYVNIHTVWLSESNPCLILDGGEYGYWEYNPYSYLYSEGYAYLDAYGYPWREGYWFLGWADEDGNIIHTLSYIDHCDRIPGVEGDDGVDWGSFHTITLHPVYIEE